MTDAFLTALAVVGVVLWMTVRLLKADSESISNLAAVALFIALSLASIYGLVRFVRWAWYR